MAKHFTDEEKKVHREAILKAGYDLYCELGYKAASVDRITERVGIAKGTFYLFFASKEVMFFQLMLKEEMRLHEAFVRTIKASTSDTYLDNLKKAYGDMYEIIQSNPILRLLTEPIILQRIMKKLGMEEMMLSEQQDRKRIEDIITVSKQFGYELQVSTEKFFEVLRGLAFAYFNAEMIGGNSKETLRYMVEVLIDDMFVRC